MGSVVAGEGPTTYLLAFIFLDGTLETHLMLCLGYPILRYPTVAPEPRGECVHSP